MANLKNKILQALQKGKNVETILNDLSKSQENLLKNHSNPVFNNKDKNEIERNLTIGSWNKLLTIIKFY